MFKRNPDSRPGFSMRQAQEPPFRLVLVDIQWAAEQREIRCVEKPMTGSDMIASNLAFVALSYRWGELPETLVDTGVGYSASITSFALDDFFDLCRMMTGEPQLQKIPYVWVDAICVDQKNKTRRKATIHRMTAIYQRAHFIIAVPDLHMRHLKQLHAPMMQDIQAHRQWMYHAISNDALTQSWLNDVPMQDLRDEALMEAILNMPVHTSSTAHRLLLDLRKAIYRAQQNTKLSIDTDHWLHCILMEIKKSHCHAELTKNQKCVEQAMLFFGSLIKDWSNRAWVISEYHIAKSRDDRTMKLWFAQLCSQELYGQPFFDYTFPPEWVSLCPHDNSTLGQIMLSNKAWKYMYREKAAQGPLLPIMDAQLSGRSFLTLILGAMATKAEDRFYSMLPLSSYRHFLKDKDTVDQWAIGDMMDVKLKLYEIMDTRDKLDLLHWSCCRSTQLMLPTFATTTIVFSNNNDTQRPIVFNFDLKEPPAIQWNAPLVGSSKNDVIGHSLSVRPRMYFVLDKKKIPNRLVEQNKAFLKQVGLNSNKLAFLVIPKYKIDVWQQTYDSIQLIGHFKTNRWVLCRFIDAAAEFDQDEWAAWYNDESLIGLDHRFKNQYSFKNSYTFKVY